MKRMPGYDLNFTTEQLDIAAGDMAIDRGTWTFKANPASGAIADSGKYFVVWKKIDGQWKVAVDMFNNDKATPTPNAAT